MAKLITAKEAFALTIKNHIAQINQIIIKACEQGRTSTLCYITDCSDKEAIDIIPYLKAAGYNASWRRCLIDEYDIVFDISWMEEE